MTAVLFAVACTGHVFELNGSTRIMVCFRINVIIGQRSSFSYQQVMNKSALSSILLS